MKPLNKNSRLVVGCLLLSYTLLAAAFLRTNPWQQPQIIPPYTMARYDQQISKIYQLATQQSLADTAQNLAFMSARFLGKPYLLGALGEGEEGLFDQGPLYRTDAFDCLTYVNTVLALTYGHNLQQFVDYMKRINYKNGDVDYVKRNHFTVVDWNINNQKNGYIKDITGLIVNEKKQPVVIEGQTLVEKQEWYRRKRMNNMKFIHPLSKSEQKTRLAMLQSYSAVVQDVKSEVAYIPLSVFFKNGKPDAALFQQIPSGTIVEIVRPYIHRGTTFESLGISHLGFAFRTTQGLVFREASTIEHHVIDIPLAEYLQHYYGHSDVKGVMLQLVTRN